MLVQLIPTNAKQIKLAVEQAYRTEIHRILLILPMLLPPALLQTIGFTV